MAAGAARLPAARARRRSLLFALWPFTRLVHVFSAPLGYLTRPYIVYRSRDDQLGSRPPRRGWERVQMSQSHSEDASPEPRSVHVDARARELLGAGAWTHHSRRAARTLLSSPHLRATVIALAQGADLAEHDAPPAATLQVLSGTVRLRAGEPRAVARPAAEWSDPPVRHGLERRHRHGRASHCGAALTTPTGPSQAHVVPLGRRPGV